MTVFFCRILCFSILAISAVGLTTAALAKDVFEVEGVFVDVTTESASQAREQAIREAQGRALDIILKRLTLQSDRDFLPWVEPNQRANYIKNFSISGEKASDVRYIATFAFQFKEDEIRKLLKSRALPFSETQSKPVLVLPLLKNAGDYYLWDESSPWRIAWSEISTSKGLVPIALPLGDLADISALDPSQAARIEEQPILALAQRYNVNKAVVAELVVAARDGNNQPVDGDIIITHVAPSGTKRQTIVGQSIAEDETPEAFHIRLAQTALEAIEEDWKRENLIQFGVSGTLPVNLLIDDLKDWIAVRKRLEGVAIINKVELALMSRDTVQINLHYVGQLDQLINSLRQVDLDLTLANERWSLINLTPSGTS